QIRLDFTAADEALGDRIEILEQNPGGYNDTAITQRVSDLEEDLLTPVPLNAVFTDTVYDDTALSAIAKKDVISYALSSPSADLTAGDTDSFHAPYDFTLDGYFIAV